MLFGRMKSRHQQRKENRFRPESHFLLLRQQEKASRAAAAREFVSIDPDRCRFPSFIQHGRVASRRIRFNSLLADQDSWTRVSYISHKLGRRVDDTQVIQQLFHHQHWLYLTRSDDWRSRALTMQRKSRCVGWRPSVGHQVQRIAGDMRHWFQSCR